MLISRSIRQNIQQYSWLTLAIVCLIAALVFWGITDGDALVEVDQPAKTEVQIQPEKVTATAHLGAFSNEVKPLDLTTRVVVSNEHAPEFRGTKFIKENQQKLQNTGFSPRQSTGEYCQATLRYASAYRSNGRSFG